MTPENWQKHGQPFGKPRKGQSKLCKIGIDPAFRKDGFAICIIDEENEVSFRIFKSFLDFLTWLNTPGEAPQNAIVCIENSNLQDATFDMSGTKAAVAKKSRNVGCNQAASQYTVDACRHHFGDMFVIEISPKEKGGKWSDQMFLRMVKANSHKLVTKYEGKKNEQDKRDAYQIALAGETRFLFNQARIKATI